MYYSCGCYCNCGDDPCGCQAEICTNCTTTSTTTMAPCIGEQCDELYDCSCIIYNGPDLACYGIYNGDNLCKILYIAASNVPACSTTTVPPTTTTTTCACLGYQVIANKGLAVSYSYVKCGESKEQIEYLGTQPQAVICAERTSIPTIVAGNGSIIPTDPICCTITTTVPVGKTQRCTAASNYYAIEGNSSSPWADFPDTFKVTMMVLNGVNYVNANTPPLTLLSRRNLVIGVGLDGNSYVMNISDWLTTIARGSGFVFHDNMRVIDKPYATATMYMEITMTDPGGTRTYYYDDNLGFGYDDNNSGIIWAGTYKCEQLK